MFFVNKEKVISLESIKSRTRVLFIDDQPREDIISYLYDEGWSARRLGDIKGIDTIDIIDSHIICVDIKGVGLKMGKENEGLDIAASIKKRFPQKKVILYSSQPMHNIFHEATGLVDRRIPKTSGDFEVFRNEIESLAKELFCWDDMALKSYEIVKRDLPADFTFAKYEKLLKKASMGRYVDESIVLKYLPVAANVAQIISLILQVFKGL